MTALHLTKKQIKDHGAIYTPHWIVDQMIQFAMPSVQDPLARCLDPACGDGAFLTALASKIIYLHRHLPKKALASLLENKLHGFDIDKKALIIAKTNLDKIAATARLPKIKWSLHNIDSTNPKSLAPFKNKFSLVLANPPYVRIQHLGNKRRAQIKRHWPVAATGAADLYLAFFEIALYLLQDSGSLVFITPQLLYALGLRRPASLAVGQRHTNYPSNRL